MWAILPAAAPQPLMPFRRTGPGNALDGKPTFDLHQLDPRFLPAVARAGRESSAAEEFMFR